MDFPIKNSDFPWLCYVKLPDILSHIMSHIVPDTLNLSRSPWHGRHGAPTIRDTGRVGKASCNLSRRARCDVDSFCGKIGAFTMVQPGFLMMMMMMTMTMTMMMMVSDGI